MLDLNKETTKLIAFLREHIKTLTETLNNFKNGIGAEDWARSMERSHYIFEAAARHSVFSRVLEALTNENSKATLEFLHRYATSEMRRMAGQPCHSSSPTTNLMHQETLATWAELLGHIEMRS